MDAPEAPARPKHRRAVTSLVVTAKAVAAGIGLWFRVTFVDLVRQLRWSYLPPLMV